MEPGYTPSARAAVPFDGRKSSRILPLAEHPAALTDPDPDLARRDPTHRTGVSQLWMAPHHAELKQRGWENGYSMRVPDHAPGQSALPAPPGVRGDQYRFQSQSAGLSEPGTRNDVDRPGSTLGGRHHLHPAGDGVRLLGGGSGCLLAASDRLGAGPNVGRGTHPGSLADGSRSSSSRRRGWCITPTAASSTLAAITPVC